MIKKNKGFTLAELLIVVAIIAVLVAIAIPVFTSQLEKSREATDLANVRSAYAKVAAAVLSEDITAVDYDNQTGMYSLEVSLTQQKEGWTISTENLSIGGITYDDERWINDPKPNGTCKVYYSGEIYLDWGGEAKSHTGTATQSWSRFSKSAELMSSSWTTNKQIYGGDNSSLTAEETAFINKLKEQYGWDNITVDIRNGGVKNNTYGLPADSVMVTCVQQDLTQSAFASNGKYGDQTTATRIFFDPKTHEVLAVVTEAGKWGNNANQGEGFWGNSTPEVVYKK